MSKVLLGAMLAGAVMVGAAPAGAANLLANGSFEANGGSFDGWTVDTTSTQGPPGGVPQVVLTYGSASAYPTGAYGEAVPADDAAGNPGFDAVGTHGAYFVSDFAGPQTISQTINLTAGTDYTFGFDIYKPLNGEANVNDAIFTASFNGVTFASFDTSTVQDFDAGEWFHFSGASTVALSGPGEFVFSYQTNGFPAKDFVIDRVYLSASSDLAVPEPATWGMMLLGFGLVGSALRSRRRGIVAA